MHRGRRDLDLLLVDKPLPVSYSPSRASGQLAKPSLQGLAERERESANLTFRGQIVPKGQGHDIQ